MHSEIRTLENNRKYRLTFTGKEYIQGEYSSGGIKVCTWEQRLNKGNGTWVYIDHFRDIQTVENFLLSMKRAAKID